MKTVSEVSRLSGVSVRTLHYYDKIGLLKPTAMTESGYRLYDDAALEKLQYIMLYRELEFSLTEIKEMLGCKDFDRNRILDQQIQLLTLKKEHIENLITFARGIRLIGVKNMDFSVFNTKEIDDYAAQAKALYGKTDAYKEYEQKTGNMSRDQVNQAGQDMMELFVEFGQMRDKEPGDEAVQAQVKKLQDLLRRQLRFIASNHGRIRSFWRVCQRLLFYRNRHIEIFTIISPKCRCQFSLRWSFFVKMESKLDIINLCDIIKMENKLSIRSVKR